MCGISVVASFDSAIHGFDAVNRMHETAAHRGPDGEGWLVVDRDWHATEAPCADALRDAVQNRPLRLAGAFRWLHIQSFERTGAQPMASPNGDVWLFFNGEVYNHHALRRELGDHGRVFQTTSDTEVLLAAYERWGVDCFSHVNGMWGAVIVDLARHRIVVSRDRFGIRPLFYKIDGQRLVVASEAKQIVAAAGERPRANHDAVVSFLRRVRLACDETFFEGIRAVPPATYAWLDMDQPIGEICFTPYWHLQLPTTQISTRGEASEHLEQLLEESIALQSDAAVPVGSLLSGGLDSSIVSALLVETQRRAHRRSTFVSVTAEGATGSLDERPYMRSVASAFQGSDLVAHEAPLTAAWVDQSIDRVTWHQEEPLGGVALIAQYRAFESAAALGLKVVLEGTGADELFCGYPRHQFARILEHVQRRQWWASAAETVGACRHNPPFARWLGDYAVGWIRRRTGFSTVSAPDWLHATQNGGSIRTAALAPPTGLSTLGRISFQDITRGNVPAVLAIGDRSAMAHSIESRVPFLDHDLVSFAFGLADDLKTSRGEHKIVLRDVARRRLPQEVAERRARIGFGAPIRDWMRGPLRKHFVETAQSPVVRQGDWFDPAATDQFIARFLDGRHQDEATVWRIDAVTRWMRVYDVVN